MMKTYSKISLFLLVPCLLYLLAFFLRKTTSVDRSRSRQKKQSLHPQQIYLKWTNQSEISCDGIVKDVFVNDTLWVLSHSWNDKGGLLRAIESVKSQKRSFVNVHHVIYEDYSDNLLGATETENLPVTFVKAGINRVGSAGAKWALFEYAERVGHANDYVIMLDGDDVFYDNTVLYRLHEITVEKQPWFLYGKHNGRYTNQCARWEGGLDPAAQWAQKKSLFCHPRVFRLGLLQFLQKKDFQDKQGNWLQKATDAAFFIPMMGLSGIRRSVYWETDTTYNYSTTVHSGALFFSEKVKKENKETVMHRDVPSPILDTVIVIICSFKRPAYEWMKHLSRSTGVILNVHVCLNDPDNTRLTALQTDAVLFSSLTVGFTIHHTKNVRSVMERFFLARELYKKQIFDYFVIVDDDQLVTPTTIHSLWEMRKPRSTVSWFGKVWLEENQGNYWKPEFIEYKPTIKIKRPDIIEYDYAGPGMSVIDASILNVAALYNLEFQMIDDLWLSFILRTIGWSLLRAPVFFLRDIKKSGNGLFPTLRDSKQKAYSKLGSCLQGGWAQSLNKQNYMKSRPKQRVSVCITGQTQRVETTTKIKHLLLPLLKTFRVSVVLSVRNTNYFTNTIATQDAADESGEGTTLGKLQSIFNELRAQHSNLENLEIVTPDESFKPIDPLILSQYPEQLASRLRKDIVRVRPQVRALNHIRQYETLSKCADSMAVREADFAIRIRDDAVITSTPEWDNVLQLADSDAIVTQTCASWSGINDKMAVIGKSSIYKYFKLPLQYYGEVSVDKSVTNPETYYKFVYSSEDIPLLHADLFIVTSRMVNGIVVPRGTHRCEEELIQNMEQKIVL